MAELASLVVATTVLIIIPGPNVALIVANSLQHGFRMGMMTDLDEVTAAPVMFLRGCMLAAVNPKTMLFNAAFLPQFVGSGSASQFALVGAVFLGVILLGDLAWAFFASSARNLLTKYSRLRNKISGAFLTTAGIGLALARRV